MSFGHVERAPSGRGCDETARENRRPVPRLMRDDVERVLHQMPLEHRDGGGAGALHDLR
jgi:hypothetical protein